MPRLEKSIKSWKQPTALGVFPKFPVEDEAPPSCLGREMIGEVERAPRRSKAFNEGKLRFSMIYKTL